MLVFQNITIRIYITAIKNAETDTFRKELMLPYDNSTETMEQVAQMMEEENLYYKKLHQEKLQDPEYIKKMEKLAKQFPNNPFLKINKQSSTQGSL